MGGLNSRINLSLTKLGAQMSPLEDQVTPDLVANIQPSASPLPGQVLVSTAQPVAAISIADDQTVITSSDKPKLFVVKAEFNNSCFLRYLIDGKSTKEEQHSTHRYRFSIGSDLGF